MKNFKLQHYYCRCYFYFFSCISEDYFCFFPQQFPNGYCDQLKSLLVIIIGGIYPEQGKWRKIISDGEKEISLIEENAK